MQTEYAVLLVAVLAVLAALGMGAYRFARNPGRAAAKPRPHAIAPDGRETQDRPVAADFQVSYVPPEFEWSGTTSGTLPLKTLTYKQYECLEDARYGFRIVGLPPAERALPQAHKTRAHGMKTVASLSKHGFLDPDGTGGHVINDHGLNALAVCSVRY